MNAHTTPNANVMPKVRNGGSGDKELARNADTVVTTASVKATLNIENALIHACAAESVYFLASSYPL